MKPILVGCLMLLSAGMLSAQAEFNVKFTMKTPFAVAGTTFPAGSYQIRVVDDDANTLECTTESGVPTVMFEADVHEVTPTATEVTFAKYGDKLVLKNVSIAGDKGYFVPLSAPEKKAKKTNPKATKVSVSAAKS
jgi:hypothetical protein